MDDGAILLLKDQEKLVLNRGRITDNELSYLQSFPLDLLEGCDQITNQAIFYLKSMPIRALSLKYCKGITIKNCDKTGIFVLQSFKKWTEQNFLSNN